jgi:phosphoglycolate phosphatase-like HAD superfamily hydrolase
MVGDSPHDYRAARAAGYRFFWAVYGYCRSIEEHADSPITPLERFAAITEHLQ